MSQNTAYYAIFKAFKYINKLTPLIYVKRGLTSLIYVINMTPAKKLENV